MMGATLAEMCKTARARMRLSQSKFAEIVGTNQTEVSFIERGFVPQDQGKIDAIKKLYRVVTDPTPPPPIGKTITIGKFVYPREEKDNEQREAE